MGLIAVTLLCVDGEKILWPQKDDIKIPLFYLGDNMNDTYWKNKVQKKKINAKFVILKQVREKEQDHGDMMHIFMDRRDEMVFNDDEDIQRVSIDDILKDRDDTDKDKDKCLVLEKKDINDELFDKIMTYGRFFFDRHGRVI